MNYRKLFQRTESWSAPHDLKSSMPIAFAFLALALVVGGCKRSSRSDVAATTELTTSPPPIAAANGTPASAAAAPAPPKNNPVVPAGARSGSKAQELSLLDPATTHSGSIVSCGDNDVLVVLPHHESQEWKVISDKGLGAPKHDPMRKGCLGPNTDCDVFRWSTLEIKADSYRANFSAGSAHASVDIRIDPSVECE